MDSSTANSASSLNADPFDFRSPAAVAVAVADELDQDPRALLAPASASRSFSPPPSRTQLRSASGPAASLHSHPLNSARSNPVLLPSRPPGTVKNMANRLEHTTAAPPTEPYTASRERYKRPTTASRNAAAAPPTSPVSASSGEGKERTRLQKKRPDHVHKSARQSPETSFEANSSFSSATTADTVRTTRSQPHAAPSPRRPRSPGKQLRLASSRPLFGEITADGRWNGNFDVGIYGPLPTFEKTPRRGSEGSLALGHGRSQSHQDISTPLLAPPAKYTLNHRRSRSDMDAFRPQPAPSMPDLSLQAAPALYPTPPDSVTRVPRTGPPLSTSRIPISSRRQSTDSTASSNAAPISRSTSAMSLHARKLSRSPTRPHRPKGKENNAPSSRSRYHPPPISTINQTLSAKIVAPLTKTSPPLRSSRPRQPVSSATTSASRARAAERFHNPNAQPRDGRRPSEQWLGKPYDPQKERTKRKIPELGNIDFEERRAKIQTAIAASLKSSESQDSMRSQSRCASRSQTRIASTAKARVASQECMLQAHSGADQTHDEGSTPVMLGNHSHRPRGLSLDTTGTMDLPHVDRELLTSHTERTMFEDESPVLGRPVATPTTLAPSALTGQSPILLTPATYRPPSRGAVPTSSISVSRDAPPKTAKGPSVLDNVLAMRERSESSASRSGTEFADDSPSATDSPSDLGDKWGLGNGVGGDHGSIRIMLDDDTNITQHPDPWDKQQHTSDADVLRSREYNQHAFSQNGYIESPTDAPTEFSNRDAVTTPRRHLTRDDTLTPAGYHQDSGEQQGSPADYSDDAIARVLDYYQSTGTITAEMLDEMQTRMVDLHRISANGGSDANMIQSLLDSIARSQPREQHTPEKQTLQPATYGMPTITPDTPPMGDGFVPGTVIVYGSEAQARTQGIGEAEEEEEEEEDFEAKIRKADEEWERQQRGEGPSLPLVEDEDKPPPPPKDFGYTPRSSVGATFSPSLTETGLRISTSGALDLHGIQAAGDRVEAVTSDGLAQSPQSASAPPLPSHAPPPPPPSQPATQDTVLRGPLALPDVAAAKAYSERGSSEVSPRFRKGPWAPSGSSRPSVDSQRGPLGLPGSQSMTSFTESTRQASMDTGGSSMRLQKTTSPGPEQKRLLKRRHVIKELLDTENTYHQDLKIIEDIYKATCGPEILPADDRKVLFGNCNEVEEFSLHFYDELRKAAALVYTPPKQQRFLNKRGSFSTTQSDGTTNTFADAVDDDKDRTTTLGRTFLMNLPRMEQVYGAYLKNHGAANQRLSSIQGTQNVKCWLDECHANASDITSAWDLDSLLVKPTQRVAKYPMLLHELMETTPPDHPDHQDLKGAAKDLISMLTRINEAKKRADIVDQIVNPGKRKDTDIRSGLAKAFGRRTEKLKERVGIAEAYQDQEFDQLAHKFGGHFIRLQICMRDVQDYMHRTDKAIELINNYANALELFTDVSPSTLPEIESKWRKYGQVIRDLTLVAFGEHKADVQKRVLAPMIQCIKLHDGPQNAINKRKKKMIDYAKCQSDERSGKKPDKKAVEAADMYLALNDQLKLDLPKLYSLTAQLVQNCLNCFIDIQMKWHNIWDRKLRPVLEAADIPQSVQQIESAFHPDFVEIEKRCNQLSICNGTLKIEAASFLSPQVTYADTASDVPSSKRRTSTLDSSNRTLSVGSESSTTPNIRRHSGIHMPDMQPSISTDHRMRSNSAMSTRGPPSQTPGSAASAGRPWSNSNAITPTSSFSGTRPTTADTPPLSQSSYFPRQSADSHGRSQRPTSDATWVTARAAPGSDQVDQHRFSGLFNSALPPDIDASQDPMPPSSRAAPDDMHILFVCASLFEFSIDKTRKEGGYPYLQYVQGEVFDVVAQKGELWLAKNQDDSSNELGWIWEQHFIILSEEV